MGDSYTSAALRGFGDSYTSAALRGFGDSYTSAALRGCGDSYTSAALRGCGKKFKKGSPEAKAFMARLRAMRGKKTKGGGIFKNIIAALGLIPGAIKSAHEIYNWVKGRGRIGRGKGGHAIILDKAKRDAFIEALKNSGKKGRSIGGLSPYTLAKAPSKAAARKATVNAEILKYLDRSNKMDDALETATTWKNAVSDARKYLGLKSAYVKRGRKSKSTAAVPPIKIRIRNPAATIDDLPSVEF